MSNAIAGVGTVFQRWNTTTGLWDSVAEVNNISGPGMTRDTIDVTSLASTGGYREFIGGFRDGGELTFSMNFVRADYDTMKADYESDDLQDYEVVLPDDEVTSIEFQALVTNLPLTISPDDKVTVDVTLKISGEVTIESGSGS